MASRGAMSALAGPSRRAVLLPRSARQISTLPRIPQTIRPPALVAQRLRFRLPSPFRTTFMSLIRPRYASTTATAPSSSPNSNSNSNSKFQSDTHGSNAPPDPDPEPEPTSAYARFKAMSKKYGWWAVGVYALLSPIDFSIILFFIHAFGAERFEPLLDSGVRQYRLLRHGEEETKRLEEHDAEVKAERERKDREEEAKGGKKGGGWGSRTLWAEIGLAYAIHKTALLPVRAGLTVAITPKLVNWLTARGWVGKGGLTRAKDHAQGKIKDASQRVRERVRPAKE